MKAYLKNTRALLAVSCLVTLVVGATIAYGAIYFDYRNHHPDVHPHANFALFIEGKRFDFSAAKYMEDVTACSVSTTLTPKERTHLHNGVPDVIHTHDTHVTWQDFFTNVGFRIDATHIITDSGAVYTQGNGKTLKFILNDKEVNSPMNHYIEDEDHLLISYGTDAEQQAAATEFATIPETAHTYNETSDPASCAGSEEHPYQFLFWR